MQLLEVNSIETVELFHQVASRIYRDDPNWIPHVIQEIEQIFDRDRNGGFSDGDAIRWVLFNRNFEPVGRIAAFYNKKDGNNTIGGIGFYECEDNDNYATALFNIAEEWLKTQGLTGVDGPINFGERHQFWGCLSEGKGSSIYQENYNPHYYTQQFIKNGYAYFFDSYCYEINISEIPFNWLDRVSKRSQNQDFTYKKFKQENAKDFASDYLTIASKAFQLTNRSVKIDQENIINQLNVQKSVLKEDFIWFAYKQEKPIGVIGYVMNWSGMVQHALNFSNGPQVQSLKGFVVAIDPAYQQKGVLVGLLHHFGQALLANEHINKLYICGIAGYSKAMQKIVSKFNGHLYMKHLTFRKFFNGSSVIPFYN